VPHRKAIWNANGVFVSVLLTHLFYCMFFCSVNDFSTTGCFMPKFACGRTLVPDMSSPLLGVSGIRGVEKGGNEIFVTIGVDGEFLHFGCF